MKPGTRVYWYWMDPEERWRWRNNRQAEKPKVHQKSGTVVTEPQLKGDEWVCLVTRDEDGRIVEFKPTDLYTIPRDLPL